jgi:gas vesicle protein
MKSFLAGLGIGIGIGLLFAPFTGEETRERLSQRSHDLADSARRHAGEIADTARDIVDHSRHRVRSTIANMRKKGGELGRSGTGTFRDL